MPNLSVSNLIRQFRDLDVKLWVDDDRLRCTAPVGVLSEELKSELARRKPEIMAFLASSSKVQQPIPRVARNGRLPVSPAQHRLWFLDQLEPGNAAYNIPGAMRLEGSLDLAALERSIGEIVRRHEVLRTRFVSHGGEPFAEVIPIGNWGLPVEDIHRESDVESTMLRLAAEEALIPFQLAEGPLFRARLLRLGNQDNVLLLTVHHIVFDGWSLAIFASELAQLYTAFVRQQPTPLEALPIQYVDYASWYRRRLDGGQLQQQLDYWEEQLTNELPVIDLPLDRQRPALQTFGGTTITRELPALLATQLRTLAQQNNATLFMVLLAGFKALLSRYSGQQTIVVGSPTAGRTRTEIEGLIGYFLNNLVLLTDTSGSPSFQQLVQRVRETVLNADDNQDVPFERLVEFAQHRSLSHSPLFQVLFILQNFPSETLELPGVTLRPVKRKNETSRFDLTFEHFEIADGIRVSAEFNTDLFDEETIDQLLAHYQHLLEEAVSDPQKRLGDLNLLSASEERVLLEDWNATSAPYARTSTLADLFEAQVQRRPEAVAAIFEDQSLTYGELNRRANQLAHYLQEQGVGPDQLVGICVDRSLELLIGLLAILKAGGAYVPLDPVYPQERLDFMLSDAGVNVLISQSRSAERLPPLPTLFLLDRDRSVLDRYAETNPERTTSPEDLAYVIYTSGSTGKPKGVEITHSSLLNFLESMRLSPGMTDDDCLLAVTTICFDISKLEFYLPLLSGARLVIASVEETVDGSRLQKLISKHRVTVMQATPATWRLLLQSGWCEAGGVKVLCGGEALSRELADQILATGAELWNLYGPTETTIWSATCRIQAGNEPISIGRPIANTETYILDERQRPVPIGVVGELHIGGAGLARGYRNRPELTNDKFIPHPFGDESARLYKTGDLARFRRDGTLECLGRLDHQIKLRGFRIELGEIESVLVTHPAVREGAVLVREDTPNDERLVAYWVSQPGATCTTSELRRHLQQQLPEHMIPSVFLQLDALPLTANGKVDRKQLPAPQGERPTLESSYVAPSTDLEHELATIWQEVLKLEQVGIHDNFFDLGGNSLLVVMVQSRLKDRRNDEIPLIQFFQHPTVSDLAQFLSQEKPAERSLSAIHDRARRQRSVFDN